MPLPYHRREPLRMQTRTPRSIASAALAVALALPYRADAGPTPGTNMLTTASNAQLPAARENFGMEDASGNFFTFGSGLFPVYQTATATTANTTNASPTITVASASNISLGDSIWATFVPAGAYVTNIAGSTVTMSQNATATGTATAVTFGQDRFTAGSTAFTNTLGAEYGYFGAAAKNRTTWPNQYWDNDPPASQSLYSVSPGGQFAGIFASRASDNPRTVSTNTIPLGALVVNDATGLGIGTWAEYLEGHTLSTASVTAHINEESSLVNGWTPIADDPYTKNPAGLVTNLRLDVGIGSGVTNNATDALEIVSNGGKYKAGITVGATALDTSGGPAAALALAQNHGIFWYSGAGNAAWQLYSTATSGANALVLGPSTGLDEAGAGLTEQSNASYFGLALTPSSGNAGQPYIELDGVGTGKYPFLELARARGTAGSLTAVQNADTLFQIVGSAHDGTSFGLPVEVYGKAEENFSTGHHAASLHLQTVATDETLLDRIAVGNQGGVTVGNPSGGDKGAGTLNVQGQLYQNGGPVAVASGGTGDSGTAWTAWTPTLSCTTGTLTTTSASGVYKTLGKQVWVRAHVVLTNIGSCSGYFNIAPPVAADATVLNFRQPIMCEETAVNGSMFQWLINAAGLGNIVLRYDATSSYANGYTFECNGTYEAN